jgi:hypothetical protein|tara:strand:+ start:528 stop:794 length:267 start_codon:yes stop_codon:yes gene_type:complete
MSIAAALIAVVGTLLMAWLSVGRDLITEPQVRRIVMLEAPYVQDRQALQQNVQRNIDAVVDIRDSLQTIQVAQVTIETKLDLIIASLD